jgi:hypothetical protein
MRLRLYAPAAAAFALTACGGPSPDAMAQETTRAVYANDIAGTTKYFDGDLKAKVTRESLGSLSDRMHALGSIKSFKTLHADPAKGEYEFTADMDRGAFLVFVKIDQQHRISGFRLSAPHS